MALAERLPSEFHSYPWSFTCWWAVNFLTAFQPWALSSNVYTSHQKGFICQFLTIILKEKLFGILENWSLMRASRKFDCNDWNKSWINQIGWFQKISIPIPRAASRNSEGEGVTSTGIPKGRGGYVNWNSENVGGFIGLEFRRHTGVFRRVTSSLL